MNIKLLQLNIFLRPPPINSLGGEYKDARMEKFANEHLAKYDLVCLQECFGTLSSRRQRLIARAEELGFQGATYSKLGCPLDCSGNFKFTDGGLVILSRGEQTYTEFRQFSAACEVDRLANKGVLYARVDLATSCKRQLHVFTTHTQASYNFAANQASLDVKAAQVAEMAQFVREMTAEFPVDWPIIICGDFNMDTLQASCPEYDATVRELAGCSRALPGGVGSAFVDVMRQEHGAAVATTVPFEWAATSGLAKRSSLLVADDAAYRQVVSSREKEAKAGGGALQTTSGEISASLSFVRTPTSYWCDQCLDYVFAEAGTGLRVVKAAIEPLACNDGEGLPFLQISDHHGIEVHFELQEAAASDAGSGLLAVAPIAR